jgi:hypothetical protein
MELKSSKRELEFSKVTFHCFTSLDPESRTCCRWQKLLKIHLNWNRVHRTTTKTAAKMTGLGRVGSRHGHRRGMQNAHQIQVAAVLAAGSQRHIADLTFDRASKKHAPTRTANVRRTVTLAGPAATFFSQFVLPGFQSFRIQPPRSTATRLLARRAMIG